VEQLVLLTDLPPSMKCRVVSDLKRLTKNTKGLRNGHGYAEMSLSECYAIGYGVKQSLEMTTHLVGEATTKGSEKAKAWYPRLCVALNVQPIWTDATSDYQYADEQLLRYPGHQYLCERIRLFMLIKIRQARLDAQLTLEPHSWSSIIANRQGKKGESPCFPYHLTTFNHLQIDELGPLQLAAWLGWNDDLQILLDRNSNVNEITRLGRTATHYACLGGHLPTLQLILSQGGRATIQDKFGLTPLHVCTFFKDEDCETATTLLLQHGATLNSVIDKRIYWEEHDIDLGGTPLECAIVCRNESLVRILLDQSADDKCGGRTGQHIAVSHFYWEIVALLLDYDNQRNNDAPPQLAIRAIRRPFGHWLAHGADHMKAIKLTMDVLEDHNLAVNKVFQLERGNGTILLQAISDPRIEDDFEVIRELIRRKTDVKHADEFGFTALTFAISRNENNDAWADTLDLLISHYEIHELEKPYSLGLVERTYLEDAVAADNVVAARALLTRGVDVNLQTDEFNGILAPLHQCIKSDKCPEMVNLLLQFGADLDLNGVADGLTPLQSSLFDSRKNFRLLDLLLDQNLSRSTCVDFLHFSLGLLINVVEDKRIHSEEFFRHLLCHPKLNQYIDEYNEDDQTLAFRVAAMGETYAMTILIEAGANILRPSSTTLGWFLPIQITLLHGIVSTRIIASNPKHRLGAIGENIQRISKEALEVAWLLVKEYRAQGSDRFEGITKLHLAAYMGLPDTVRHIIADSQLDITAKGMWPGMPCPVSARKLLESLVGGDGMGLRQLELALGPEMKVQNESLVREISLHEVTDHRIRHFKDLDDTVMEGKDGREIETTFAMAISPRLIYEHMVNMIDIIQKGEDNLVHLE